MVNLGTPDAPTKQATRRYLKEFLGDPRVVAIPRLIWWLILNGLILRTRPSKSAAAYQKVWTERGSPLLVLTQDLTRAVAEQMSADDVLVVCAMRYGSPSIREGLQVLQQKQVEHLLVLPLYPQYSVTTTVSIFDQVQAELGQGDYQPEVDYVVDYHNDAVYIKALAKHISQQRQAQSRLLLFSFHGLPEHSKKVGDPYYYQCLATARLIAQAMGLQDDQWKLVFQSRFGRAKWLMPYCVEVLQQLPQQGIKAVDVVCPGFAVDCLETLEEIAMTNRDIFLQAGGESYHYISALNDEQAQIDMFSGMIRRYSRNF